MIFCDFSAKSLNTLRLCYEIEGLTKNTFLCKITKLTFLSSFVVNKVFESRVRKSFSERFSHALAFKWYGLSVLTKLNVFR